MTPDEYLKTLPDHEQRRINRGDRLLRYIIAKRCQHPELLAGGEAEAAAGGEMRETANPPARPLPNGKAPVKVAGG